MKNVLLKFAGLFVERVPVDERGNPVAPGPTGAPGGAPRPNAVPGPNQQPPAGHPGMSQPGQAPGQPMQPGPQPGMVAAQPGQLHPAPGAPAAAQPMHGTPMPTPPAGMVAPAAPAQPVGATGAPISVALRAWVPQEYAAHLAPFGVHVIAAGGSVTSEQARGWGADVLVVSAECLGQDVHLLQQPQLPTVFITPQPVMIPDVAGVVQVQEPLRASDVSQAARDAVAAFAAARR